MQKYDHHPNRKVGDRWRNITLRRAIDCTGTEICRGRTGFPQPDRDHSVEHLFARRPALIKQIAEKRFSRENNCTSPCCLSVIARQPSNLISYCQSSPAGRVSTDLQSIGGTTNNSCCIFCIIKVWQVSLVLRAVKPPAVSDAI